MEERRERIMMFTKLMNAQLKDEGINDVEYFC